MTPRAAGDSTGDTADVPPDGPTITIGTQDFGESAILSQIYGQVLINAGYSVEYQELGGYRDLEVPAFESGDINFAPEYVASMLEFLNEFAGEATSDVDETVGLLPRGAGRARPAPPGPRAVTRHRHQHLRGDPGHRRRARAVRHR